MSQEGGGRRARGNVVVDFGGVDGLSHRGEKRCLELEKPESTTHTDEGVGTHLQNVWFENFFFLLDNFNLESLDFLSTLFFTNFPVEIVVVSSDCYGWNCASIYN